MWSTQQSIGILTLNWKSQSYFNVIKEIKAKMEGTGYFSMHQILLK
jgi:hypothetical protein